MIRISAQMYFYFFMDQNFMIIYNKIVVYTILMDKNFMIMYTKIVVYTIYYICIYRISKNLRYNVCI